MPTKFCPIEKITECADSPKSQSAGLNSSKVRTFEIFAPSDLIAYELLKAYAPKVDFVPGDDIFTPLVLAATPVYKIDTIRGYDVPNSNGKINAYKGTVEYKHAGRDEQTTADNELIEPNREKVTCSFSGTTAKVTTARSQKKYGTNSRDVGNQVNVQYNGEVEGVDINVATGSFTVATVIHKDTATNQWFKDRFSQIWTLNNATFRSWPKGSVAFSGMDARQRADGNWEIDYSFVIQVPETISDIGGISTGGSVNKEGFEYAWIMFRPKDDTNKIVPEAIGAYLATLYKYSNFAQLGIQT